MKVEVKTSNRVDFAGGTLDLYPVYLFLNGGITVNGGVSIHSRVIINTRNDGRFHIASKDLDSSACFDSLDEMNMEGETAFIQKALLSYRPRAGLDVVTENMAPKGSGLGASSSLLTALSAALFKIENPGMSIDIHRLIDRCAAIEASWLGIPTGKQDYYGAVLGKIHALHFDEKGCSYEELTCDPDFRENLNASLIISFTGISHYSGANNWDMLKMAIDRIGGTYEKLEEIKRITLEMRRAFIEQDLEKIGILVNREWENRKQLAPGVTNDFIDSIAEGALKRGAWGSKLCGAGGGGCMITLAPAGEKKEIIGFMQSKGVEIMDAGIDYEGMQICIYDHSGRLIEQPPKKQKELVPVF